MSTGRSGSEWNMDYLNYEWLGGSVAPVQPSSAGNVSTTEATQLTPRTQLVLEILLVLMCLGAVTGNSLVILIVAATKTFHCVTSVLIINLAISDLMVGVGVMPFVAVSVMNTSWVDRNDLCLYVGYTSSVYCTASVLTLAAIAVDRYQSIVDCLRYSSRVTLWRTCSVVLWIWLQALATSGPPLLGWGSISYVAPMFSCTVNWDDSPSYTGFVVIVSFLLPAAVILFCHVNIVKVARGHARRIHSLEDSLQRGRLSSTTASSSELTTVGDSTVEHCGSHHGSSTLVYHVSGRFLSEVQGEGCPAGSGAPPQASSDPTSRRSISLPAHGGSTDPKQTSSQQQQHHISHRGIVRLFLIISAFFLCWTPYVGVAVVQATENAISGKSNLLPSTAITFSYLLVLLNSDINPLLYALLSKRFQGALQNLRQKVRARLGKAVGRGEEGRADWDKGRTTTHPDRCSSSESSGRDESKYCSDSIFTVKTSFKHDSKEHVCGVLLPGSSSSSSSSCRVDYLQVPSRPQEGSRLPFSAATKERQATFFFGQITVRVEHDVASHDVCLT